MKELRWRDEHVKAESLRVVRERAMWELSKLVTSAPSGSQGWDCSGVPAPGCSVAPTLLLQTLEAFLQAMCPASMINVLSEPDQDRLLMQAHRPLQSQGKPPRHTNTFI